MSAHLPDITLFDKLGKTIYLREVTVPFDPNLEDRLQEKISKYAGLVGDLAHQHVGWQVKVATLAVGALGSISRKSIQSLTCFVDKFQIPLLIQSIQQSATLGTNRIIRNHLVGPV